MASASYPSSAARSINANVVWGMRSIGSSALWVCSSTFNMSPDLCSGSAPSAAPGPVATGNLLSTGMLRRTMAADWPVRNLPPRNLFSFSVARSLAAGRDRSRPIYDNRQRLTSESTLVAEVSEDGAGGKNGRDWGRIFRGTSRNLLSDGPSAAAVQYWCKPLEHQCSDRFLCAPAEFSTAFSTGFCGKVTSAGTSIALMRYHDSVELWCHLVAFVFPQKQPVPRRGLRSAVVLE